MIYTFVSDQFQDVLLQFCMSRYISPHYFFDLLAILGLSSSQALFSLRHDSILIRKKGASRINTAGKSRLPPTFGASADSFLHIAVGRTRLPATTPDELHATPLDASPSYVSSVVDCCFCLSRIGCWPWPFDKLSPDMSVSPPINASFIARGALDQTGPHPPDDLPFAQSGVLTI